MSAFLASLLTFSTFAPDEHYQSSEPSLCMLGLPCVRTWEWTVDDPIRTSLNLYPYAGLFKLLSLLAPTVTERLPFFPFPLLSSLCISLLSAVPLHFLNGLLASMLTAPSPESSASPASASSSSAAVSSAAVISSTWFYYYSGVRSYTNTLECLLCTYVFHSLHFVKSPSYALLGVACSTAVVLRFSAGVYFLPLFLHHIYLTRSLKFLLTFLPSLLLTFLLLHSLDCSHYSRPLLSLPVTLNNINFNVLTNSSSLYGTHPFHWYLTSCIPQIVGAYLPFLLHSYAALPKVPSHLVAARLVAAFYVAVHSLSGHKELRFLFPVLPLFLLEINASALHLNLTSSSPSLRLLRSANVVAFLFLSLVWQSGSILALHQIGLHIDATFSPAVTVDLATSCHATPAHTHLFHPAVAVEIKAVDCHVTCRRTDTCENDSYLSDPSGFLSARSLSADFVVTENNWEAMGGRGYEEIGRWWERPGEYVVVWKRVGYGRGGGRGGGEGEGSEGGRGVGQIGEL